MNNFEKVVDHLLEFGKAFKFTGGEPCLNSELYTMLEMVKSKGGTCFLDTNGSFPSKVKHCIDEGLIDVLAVSLKGLSPDKVCETAGISNKKLCWDNVMETISYSSKSDIPTIITHVIYNDFSYTELEKFAGILRSCGNNIFLKINNLMPNDYNKDDCPVEHKKVIEIINHFVEENQDFAGRIIYIGDKSAVTDIECIKHY